MAGIEAGLINVLIAPKLVQDFAGKLGFDLDKGVGDAGEKAGESLGKRLGEGFTKTGKNLTKTVTAPIVAGFGALVANALNVDNAFDTLRAKTGLVGEEAEALQQSFKNVAANVPASLDEVAASVSSLTVELGLSGKPLEELSTAFLQLGEVTGEALDPKAFSDVAKRFQIPSDQLVGSLDQLLRASQKTGVSIGTLTSALETNAATLTELGFSYTESIAFIGGLEKAGFNAAQVLGGLRKAYLTAIGGDKDAEKASEDIAKATDARTKAEQDLAVAQLKLQELQAKGGPGSKEAAKDQERLSKLTQQLTQKRDALAVAELKLTELYKGKGPANAGAAQLKLQEKIRVKTGELTVAQQKLNETLANPKAAQSAVTAAQNAVQKVTNEIATLKAEAAKPVELKLAPDSAIAAAQLAVNKLSDDIKKLEADAAKSPSGGATAAGSEILKAQNEIARLQKEIADNNTTIESAQSALAQSAQNSGKSIGEFTLEAIANIKRLSDAGDEAAANAKAKELFGRSAIETLQAVEAGAFDFTALAKEIEFGTESVQTAFLAVVDFPQQLEIFRNRLGLALQPVGAQLFPVIEKAIATVLPLIERLINLFVSLPEGVQTGILVLAGLAAAVGPVLVGLGQLVTAFTAVAGSQAAAAIGANLLRVALAGLGIGLLIAAIVLLIQNWDTVKRVSLAFFEALKDAVGGAINFIKSNWQNLLIILTGPFAPAVLLIKKNWDSIKSGAVAAVNAIKSVLSGIGNAIASPFKSGYENVVKFLSNLRTQTTNVINAIIALFRNLQTSVSNAIGNILRLPGFAQIAKVFGAVTGVFSLGKRAEGGPVTAGEPYLVGEQGPEIVVPNKNGYVLPNNILSGMLGSSASGNASYTVNVYNPVAEPTSSSIPAALRRANLLRSSS